jgi:glycosyltransferase involved in cell wall biosynthesis
VNRIAFTIPTLDRLGGAETQAMLLAKGLAGRSWRVDVIALSGDGCAAKEALAAAGVQFFSLNMRHGLADPRGWRQFNRWLTRQRPQIVHAHLPHAAWLTRWSRLFARDFVVVDTIHTSATGTRGRQLGYRWSDRLADCVTAVSESAAQAYLAAKMVSRRKLVVMANGIDADAWKPDSAARRSVREKIGIGNEFLWVSAGRLEPVKDFATLLQAFRMIPQPARLVICGAGTLQADLQRLIGDLDLEERVLLLGCVSDERKWLQAADGFVLASLWEGLPMCVLEAMACGAPVVATDVAGTRDLVTHGLTGHLAPARNVEQLATSMTTLMQMPLQSRLAIAERARQIVCERYDLERILDQWEALYETLLRAHHSCADTTTS